MLRSGAAGMIVSSALIEVARDDDNVDDDISRLPPIVALPMIGAVSLGLWVLIYKLVSGIVALFC
jgi:hypothetical protein